MTSIAVSGVAGGIGVLCWWQTAPWLWELATFTPDGPIRPMGLVGYLVLGAFAGLLVAYPLVGVACVLSRRPAAGAAAALGMIAALLPPVNFVLFWAIVVARGIELSP